LIDGLVTTIKLLVIRSY